MGGYLDHFQVFVMTMRMKYIFWVLFLYDTGPTYFSQTDCWRNHSHWLKHQHVKGLVGAYQHDHIN
jgi:hypothetical protein